MRRPRRFLKMRSLRRALNQSAPAVRGGPQGPRIDHVNELVAHVAGVHPVPFRTRQLSPLAPMVLHW